MLAAQEFLFDLNPQLLFDAALLAIAVFFLYMLMSYLLFNPARKLLKDRQDHISSELDEASADKEKAAALKAEYEAKLKEIDKEAETILADARQKALKNQNRIVNEAKEEAARIVKHAQEEALLEKKHAMNDMKQEMITVASLMAQKVVASSITAEIQSTYGDALFALAVEEHMVDQLYEEAQAVAQILRENTELTRLMNHPKIEKEEKVRLIEDIFKGRIGDELVGLLRMLVQKGHYKETDQVFTYFIDRVKEYKKIGTAYVTSAMELTPQQKQAVEQKLLDTTKYVQFEIHYTTDPALIGGMVIRIRDRVVDGSVRTRLEHLTRDLERIQLKVGECAP